MDVQFRGLYHCDLRLRLPVHFVVLVCLLLLPWHPTRDDDRLPPSVQRHGGENASAVEAALMACRSPTSWPSELPWVLLSLRSVPLEQSGVSSAELVFSSPPTLPGQFLSMLELPPMEFLDNLHYLMDPFVPTPFIHCPSPPSGPMHLPPALWEAEYVFICRRDGARPSLTPLYDGPYRVVSCSNSYFPLAISDK